MDRRSSRRVRAVLGLLAASLATGCPATNPPPNGHNPNEAADRRAIADLLDAGKLDSFFQPRLINDGVGIFSLDSPTMGPDFPRRWGRSYAFAVQSTEAALSESVSLGFFGPTEAVGRYQRPIGGKLVLDYTWQRKLLAKPFVETSERSARFTKAGGSWHLSHIGLARIRPENSGLKAGGITLMVDGQPPLTFHEDDWLEVEDLPRVAPLQRGRIEVALSYAGQADSPAFYAFLLVPPMRDRLRLRDDGLGADRKKGDGIYTSPEFSFESRAGVNHLVIDAIAGGTFRDPAMNNYDATQWGIPYRVEGGEGR